VTEHGPATPLRKASLALVLSVVAVFLATAVSSVEWPGIGVVVAILTFALGIVIFLAAVYIVIDWWMGDIYGTDKEEP
jgi:hypothetical protein